jgi:hypothetical protein
VTAFGVPTEDDDGNAASRARPVEQARPIADETRDMIATLASAANKPLEEICRAYKVESLKGLTEEQGEAAIKRLQALAKAPVNA